MLTRNELKELKELFLNGKITRKEYAIQITFAFEESQRIGGYLLDEMKMLNDLDTPKHSKSTERNY